MTSTPITISTPSVRSSASNIAASDITGALLEGYRITDVDVALRANAVQYTALQQQLIQALGAHQQEGSFEIDGRPVSRAFLEAVADLPRDPAALPVQSQGGTGASLPSTTKFVAIPGSRMKLTRDPLMEALSTKLDGWQKTAKQAGVDVEFSLGSGDLRRLLLGQPLDGPGDFELFVDVRNATMERKTLAFGLEYLKSVGVNLDELHALFPADPNKTIDVHFRDQAAIDKGGPYTTQFGAFKGEGDATINVLHLRLPEMKLEGPPDAVRALEQGLIEYIGPSGKADAPVTRHLVDPATGAKIDVQTDYLAGVIGLTLRCLRLVSTVGLSSNPNDLREGKTFVDALKGIERYFTSPDGTPWSDDAIRAHKLEPEHIQQVGKIFKGRSEEDLKVVRWLFRQPRFERTLQILQTLGIDVTALLAGPRLAGPQGSESWDDLLWRATQKQAYFKPLWPLLDAKGQVQDPFAAGNEKLLQTFVEGLAASEKWVLEGHDADIPRTKDGKIKRGAHFGVGPIPPAILADAFPELTHRMQTFAGLSHSEQVETLSAYQKALDFLTNVNPKSRKGMERVLVSWPQLGTIGEDTNLLLALQQTKKTSTATTSSTDAGPLPAVADPKDTTLVVDPYAFLDVKKMVQRFLDAHKTGAPPLANEHADWVPFSGVVKGERTPSLRGVLQDHLYRSLQGKNDAAGIVEDAGLALDFFLFQQAKDKPAALLRGNAPVELTKLAAQGAQVLFAMSAEDPLAEIVEALIRQGVLPGQVLHPAGADADPATQTAPPTLRNNVVFFGAESRLDWLKKVASS